MKRETILLSVQRALLGMITHKMKAITIAYTEKSFLLKVYFESKPEDFEIELLRDITSEVLSDFPQITEVNEIAVETKIEANKLEKLDEWVYVRFENVF